MSGRSALSRRVPSRVPPGAALGRALLGGGLALAAAGLPLPGDWERTNHRGRTVLLASGPAAALAAGLAAGLPQPAALLAAAGAAAVGRYDDVAGARPAQAGAKGFRGHLQALRAGRVTAGTVKVVGIGLTGLAAAALSTRRPAADPGTTLSTRRRGADPAAALSTRRPAADPGTALDLLVAGGLVAGSANLLNLLDLRPGRALKAGLAAALALRQPGVAAAAAALLPGDLGERTMLGDAGANGLGAVLGLALAARLPERRAQIAALAGLAALTAASEVVSYSRVIDAVPPLRWVDRLGRQA